ncbi:SpoIIE family protein phosphatase [Streptomyces sp. 15-116A]|uniref:SpoIIE family protein phosphatase n=1 Tax=Streptomyces sp. 15-116A TaxID=2259035 RepID=UPI0021B22383|nr:SpoIIE family protein phosphatase [Streptomyces sp. 15-116A]MCT7351130.1 SpoIIE family protein phosphatase [Streptomyces sp. 15-116A]
MGTEATGWEAPLLRAMVETDAYAGMIYLLPPEEQVLYLAVLAGVPKDVLAPWYRVGLATPSPSPEAVRRRKLIWISGQDDMVRRYPRIALDYPYAFAMAVAPVVAHGTCYGTMSLGWAASHPEELSGAERDSLTTAAERLAMTLEQAAIEGRPVRYEGEPRVVSVPGASANGAASLTGLITRLPEGLCALDPQGRITFVSSTAAELLGEPTEKLHGALVWSALPWLRQPFYEDSYWAALLVRQPTSFTVLRPPDLWLSFELYPDVTGTSVRITPATAEPGRTGTAAVPPAAPPVTALYHLMHLAGVLTEAVGVDDLVELLAGQITPAFGGRAMALLTVEAGRLRAAGHRGCPAEVIDLFDGLPLTSASPAARVLATGVPVLFPTSEQLRQAFPEAAGWTDRMGACAFLPLTASGRPVGTCVLTFAEPHPFTTDERAVLTSLGGLLAQALDRAGLYDSKHRLARGLQSGLLPRKLPAIPGLEAAARYIPATQGMDVGGDFYDLIRLDEAVVGAVIGDVQGHNVTAAALMGQVRTAIRAYATAGAAPAEVLARTNRLLTDLDAGLFASCLYLSLDLGRRRAGLSTAGHPPALLRGPDGQVRTLEAAGGMLLGIDREAEYRMVSVPMPVGCVLALYTDGLVEYLDVDLEEAIFDLAGLLSRGGDRPLESLADDVVRHAKRRQHRGDDIALLLLRTATRSGAATRAAGC